MWPFGRRGPADEQARAFRRLCRRGLRLSQEERFEEAVLAYEEALALAPTNLELRINLGSAYYQLSAAREGGHLAAWLVEAARHFDYVLGIDPDHVTAALNLAAVHHAQGDAAAAHRLLTRLAAAQPGHRDLHYNLAIACLQLGDEAGARAALAVELTNHPDNPHAVALQARLAEREEH